MANASAIIITDSLNLKITAKIPLGNIKTLFVDLGFDLVDIEKRDVATHSKNDLITALLTAWKTKHGNGLDQAETLKHVMKENGVDEAVKLIQAAIDKVIPPAVTGLLPDATALPTSTNEKNSPMKH
ncbi:uncharacterized protein LOC105438052 [Strongylocentrotus purpuratus]|uniref:Death domain-containing protein n=1 Tax=Strongylocentrotus purpuratus TaxID=7668 RepID=A0A7M7NH61_STRPU|nr:uncharacterized protein LOC105438052 [Strongylocentrotus purpuratus]